MAVNDSMYSLSNRPCQVTSMQSILAERYSLPPLTAAMEEQIQPRHPFTLPRHLIALSCEGSPTP
jgi:hypothetical protein